MMLVGPNFTFVSNPKTGSTSIGTTLRGLVPSLWQGDDHTPMGACQPLPARLYIATVRNPFDRMVSAHAFNARSGQTFSDWLQGPPWLMGGVDVKRCSQAYWATPQINYLMRFESLCDDWGALLKRLGLPDVELQHLRQSERPHYRDVIGNKDRKIIEDRFCYDLAQWGWAF